MPNHIVSQSITCPVNNTISTQTIFYNQEFLPTPIVQLWNSPLQDSTIFTYPEKSNYVKTVLPGPFTAQNLAMSSVHVVRGIKGLTGHQIVGGLDLETPTLLYTCKATLNEEVIKQDSEDQLPQEILDMITTKAYQPSPNKVNTVVRFFTPPKDTISQEKPIYINPYIHTNKPA